MSALHVVFKGFGVRTFRSDTAVTFDFQIFTAITNIWYVVYLLHSITCRGMSSATKCCMFIRYKCAKYFVRDLFGNFSMEKRIRYIHIVFLYRPFWIDAN